MDNSLQIDFQRAHTNSMVPGSESSTQSVAIPELERRKEEEEKNVNIKVIFYVSGLCKSNVLEMVC